MILFLWNFVDRSSTLETFLISFWECVNYKDTCEGLINLSSIHFNKFSIISDELSHFLSMTSPNAVIFNPDSTITIRSITNKAIPCFSTTEIISATSQHLLTTRDSGSYEESPDGRCSQISLHKKQRVTMDIRETSGVLPPNDRPERHLTGSSTLAPRRNLAGDPDGLAFIHLSSGTSGLPKAAMVSHRAYILMIQHGWANLLHISSGNRSLSRLGTSNCISVLQTWSH